ncbi:hypothetical protein Tco_0096674, partial [Tanacetum coccineum]
LIDTPLDSVWAKYMQEFMDIKRYTYFAQGNYVDAIDRGFARDLQLSRNYDNNRQTWPGVMLQGKRIRDDNKILLQMGICHDNVLDVLGFTLVSNELQEGITVTDMTSYGLPCARKVVAVELEVSNVKTTVTGVGSFTFSRMRQELTRLPSPRQTDKANRYAAKDNDDFISS